MPHECVDCGEVCEDGSSDVFEGCPSCGGTKFFYVREIQGDEAPTSDGPSTVEEDAEPASNGGGESGQSTLEEIAEKPAASDTTEDPAEGYDAVEIEADGAEHSSQQRARAVTVGDDDVEGAWPDGPGAGAGDGDADGETGEEEILEADGEYERAFGGKVQPGGADEDIVDAEAADVQEADGEAAAGAGDGADTITRDGKTYERVEGGEAKQQLAAEFETIKIVEPGSYELNLMNLYDRDEKIIALEEDGRYQVSLPTFDE